MSDDERPILPLNPEAELGDLPAPPKEIVRDLAPPPPLAERLRNIGDWTLCGSPFVVQFTSGPWRGQQLRMFCAEPLCIETGYCTGARFVPGIENAMRPAAARPSIAMIVAAARESAKRATGRDDPRSDEEIAAFANDVTKRAKQALRGEGQWRPT